MFSVTYELTRDELTRFFYYTNWAAPYRKPLRKKKYLGILIPGVGVAAFIFLAYNDGGTGTYVAIAALFYFAVLAAMLSGRMKAHYSKFTEALEKENDRGKVYTTTTIQFSEDSIYYVNEFEETKYKWKAVQRKDTDENAYYLYVNSLKAIVIPFRVFGSAAERQDFEKILSAHLPFLAEFPDR